MVTICKNVFSFPALLVIIVTPLYCISVRMRVTRISLKEIKIIIQSLIVVDKTGRNIKPQNADNTNNLSARGSKKTPNLDSISYFRAILPSQASVIAAERNTINASNLPWLKSVNKQYRNTGTRRILVEVRNRRVGKVVILKKRATPVVIRPLKKM